MTEYPIKEHGGIFFPAHEQHLIAWMEKRREIVDGKLTYQHHKLTKALEYVGNFNLAIDVGAHIGLWSMHLAKRFNMLHAFEPIALHRECFKRNVIEGAVDLHPFALGEQDGFVNLATGPGSSGDTSVAEEGERAQMCTLDDFGLAPDFIKLDCEGYELFALRGGEETLKRYKPCVIVEQKPGRAQKYGLGERDAVAYLQRLGATLRAEMGGDFILSWDD